MANVTEARTAYLKAVQEVLDECEKKFGEAPKYIDSAGDYIFTFDNDKMVLFLESRGVDALDCYLLDEHSA